MPTVYVTNRSTHNFEAAKEYGNIVFLTEGRQRKYNPNSMACNIAKKMINSDENDYLILTAFNILCGIAVAIFALMHKGRVNVLLFKDGRYIKRELILTEAIAIAQNERDLELLVEGICDTSITPE